MKGLMLKFKKWQFGILMTIITKYYMGFLDEFLKERVLSLASVVSQRLYMDYLTKEGLLHCGKCPQRFGLKRVNGELRCSKHAELVAA